MRSALAFLLLVACASGPHDESPVTANIVDTNITSDIRFAGPVAIRFRVEVTNPTNETVTLRKVEIHTAASGAFSARATTSFDREVAPGQTITVELHGTGSSTGGRLAAEEQVTFRGTAYFDSPHGAFVKAIQADGRVQ